MSIFNCCTCPEPPDYDSEVDDPLDKYINTCGCPSVSVECVSESKTATLRGFSEFDSSTPPKKFLVGSQSGTITETCVDGIQSKTATVSPLGSKTWDVVTNTTSGEWSFRAVRSTDSSTQSSTCINSYCGILQYYTSSNCRYPWSISGVCPLNRYFTPTKITDSSNSRVVERNANKSCGAYSGSWTATLSVEDTEVDALDRVTAIEGSSRYSLYQLRTTSFTFTKRTVTYSATASNLAIGTAYEGCVRMRRRESYSGTPPAGADTAWEDVEPDTISSFTATDTEEEIAADVVVPNVQGYEYQVLSAHVWPVSVGCDCPTSYAP